MAARTADLKVITKVDIATLRASFKEAARVAKAELAEVANLLSKSLVPDASKAKAELRKTMKELAAEARKAAGGDSIVPPTKPPKPPRETPAPRAPGGGGAPAPQDGPDFATLVAAEERKIAAIRAQYRGKTKQEDDELAKQLIDNLAEVQEKKILAINAGKRATTDAARDEAKAMKASLDEQARLLGRVAKEKSAVINDGAGAKAGILGLGRNLLNPATLLGPLTGMLGGLGIGAALGEVISGGKEFQAGVAELSAITGVAGQSLDVMAGKARNLALEFGGSASGNITAFKGILSKLGPDIAKSPEALESMTRAVNTLSAATGDTAEASMDALTTGLLQFQVSLDDPVAAAAEMTKQMNVMAAGAKEGAAEVPQVAEAIKVAGVAASNSKVSFEETNAAIQALAAGGKVGAEAGTALRNVLGKLGEGRFLPKDVQAELGKAGVDITRLGDTSLTLTDRMRELNKISGDAALVTKVFGTENAAAANILLRSTDAIDTLKEKMTGTNTALDQAAVRQATFAAQWDRFTAFMGDAAIGIFETIGPALSAGLTGVVTVLGAVGTAFSASFKFIGDNSTAFKILAAGIAAYVVIANASAITTGILSNVQKAWAATTAFVKKVQDALNLSMKANPIGAVILAVTALIAVYMLLTESLGDQLGQQIEANKAEQESLEAKKKSNLAEQGRLKTVGSLAKQYEELGKKANRTATEERKLGDIQIQLNQHYPGLISSTASYAENMGRITKAAEGAKTRLGQLGEEMIKLGRKQRQLALEGAIADQNLVNAKFLGAIEVAGIDDNGNFDAMIAKMIKTVQSGNEVLLEQEITMFTERTNVPLKNADPEEAKAARERRAELIAGLRTILSLRNAIASDGREPENEPVPPPPPPPPPGGPDGPGGPDATVAGELDLASEVNAIRAAARDKDAEAALTAIRDQTERERAALKQRYDKERADAILKQSETLRKLVENAAAADPATVKPVEIRDETGALLRTLTSRAEIETFVAEQTALALTAIERNRLEAQIELERKFESDKARVREEGMARYIEQIEREESQIVGSGEDEEVARLQKRLAVLDTQRAAEIGNALATNDELLRSGAELRIAQQQLTDATTDAERAAAQEKIRIARTAYFALRADLLKTNPEILAILRRFADERGKVEIDGDAKITDARTRERIAALETTAEQERAIAIAELDKKLKVDIEANKGNKAKLLELERQYARDRQKIEEEYARKTNVLWDAMYDIRAAIVEAFSRKVDKGREEQLRKQRDDLKKEEEQLRSSLDNKLIMYDDWSAKQADIAKRQSEIEKQLEGSTGDFITDLRIKVAGALAASHEKVNAKFAERNADLIKRGTDGEKISGRERIQQAIQAAAVVTLSIADIAAQGKLFTEEGGKAVLKLAWDTLQGLAATYIAGILGSSLGFLGPIAGPIAAGVLTALFEAAMSSAKGSILGAATGEDRITGPGSRTSDSILRKVSVDEAIIRHETANAGAGDYSNRSAIKWGNKNPGRSWREFFAPSFTVADIVAMGRQALALPALNLSAIEVTTAGIAPEAFNALAAEQAATRAELVALREQNAKMTRWIKETAKSNRAMDERDRNDRKRPTTSGRGDRRGSF